MKLQNVEETSRLYEINLEDDDQNKAHFKFEFRKEDGSWYLRNYPSHYALSLILLQELTKISEALNKQDEGSKDDKA